MAKIIPDVAHAFCSYNARRTGTDPFVTPVRPLGAIMAQAGIKEVIEVRNATEAAFLGGFYLVRLVEQLTDEEGTVELAVFPSLNQDVPANQPVYTADGFNAQPVSGLARIMRAYAPFSNDQNVGPVAPNFVMGNPNEWIVWVQTAVVTEDGDVSLPMDWSVAVQKVEVAGNKVGGEGSQAEVPIPFVQPPGS